MKKFLFLACTTFIFACQNENTELIKPGSLVNAPYISSNNFQILTGTVEFKVSKNENLVFFNLGKANQKLYYLQTTNLVQFTSSIGEGEVFTSPNKNTIILNSSATNEVIIFTLNDSPVPQGIFPGRIVKTMKGYGMGEATGDGILELYRMTDLFSIFGPKESARADSDCDAGGPGASSCSISSGGDNCDVSCNAGYYACCNINTKSPYVSCNCSPDGDPEQRIGLVSASGNL